MFLKVFLMKYATHLQLFKRLMSDKQAFQNSCPFVGNIYLKTRPFLSVLNDIYSRSTTNILEHGQVKINSNSRLLFPLLLNGF